MAASLPPLAVAPARGAELPHVYELGSAYGVGGGIAVQRGVVAPGSQEVATEGVVPAAGAAPLAATAAQEPKADPSAADAKELEAIRARTDVALVVKGEVRTGEALRRAIRPLVRGRCPFGMEKYYPPSLHADFRRAKRETLEKYLSDAGIMAEEEIKKADKDALAIAAARHFEGKEAPVDDDVLQAFSSAMRRSRRQARHEAHRRERERERAESGARYLQQTHASGSYRSGHNGAAAGAGLREAVESSSVQPAAAYAAAPAQPSAYGTYYASNVQAYQQHPATAYTGQPYTQGMAAYAPQAYSGSAPYGYGAGTSFGYGAAGGGAGGMMHPGQSHHEAYQQSASTRRRHGQREASSDDSEPEELAPSRSGRRRKRARR